jgi:hypothetical protein
MLKQRSPHLQPLHHVHALLPNAATLPFWLPGQWPPSAAHEDDGGHRWRLQGQDGDARRVPFLCQPRRADAALRLRREKLRASKKQSADGKDVEGLTSELGNLDVKGAQDAADKDEWEEVQENEVDDQEVAIRVDQYLVVFLKVSFKQHLSLYHPLSFFLCD